MSPFSLLYTHHLHGDLALLPRLYTFLKHLRHLPVADDDEVPVCELEPQARRIVLIDVGESCAPEVWHCAATGGRSMLIALDALGYDAAAAALASDDRDRMADSLLRLIAVDVDHAYDVDGVRAAPGRLPDYRGVQIILQPGESARLESGAFFPQRLDAGLVGVAHFDDAGSLTAHSVHRLPADTSPDPTIAGVIELVESEARRYERRRGE